MAKSLLQTTVIIKGAKAKELNQAIENYQKGLIMEKDAKTLKESGAKVIKDICTDAGVYETNLYTQNMTLYSDTISIDTKALKEKDFKLYQKLIELYPSVKVGGVRIGKSTSKKGLKERVV